MRSENMKTRTLAEISADLANAVYTAAVSTYEPCEWAGRLRGNGHHMAQEVAQYAISLLEHRWENREEARHARKEGSAHGGKTES